MVRLGENVRELVEDAALELPPEIVVPPGVAHQRRSVFLEPVGPERLGEHELAGCALRPRAGEEGPHRLSRAALGDQQRFRPASHPSRAGPIGVLAKKGGRPVEIRGRAPKANRGPFEKRVETTVEPRPDAVAGREVALPNRADRVPHRRDFRGRRVGEKRRGRVIRRANGRGRNWNGSGRSRRRRRLLGLGEGEDRTLRRARRRRTLRPRMPGDSRAYPDGARDESHEGTARHRLPEDSIRRRSHAAY